MSYTVLRVTEGGVLFRAHHARRFDRAGPRARAAFESFCQSALPGIHVLRFEQGALRTQLRAASRLQPGIAVRWRVSPHAGRVGGFAKPAPPCPYDAVRASGVATLLTDARGEELLEACSASVIAWTGDGWIAPPDDRPRVQGVAEAALRASGILRSAPIQKVARQPILLVNAVIGACTVDPAQLPLPPEDAVAAVERALLEASR